MKTSKQIRKIWLDFWKSKKHLIIDSSSLIPNNDPTLLWINAGVAPLKKYFDGSMRPPKERLSNLQKCLRTNDIENVGLTSRHHTFFEMMGNFSIGDYFKKEVIPWALELMTDKKYFGFEIEKLYITYYPDDIETKNLWIKTGFPKERLIPSNECYWQIGEGPAGPCTEIYYDRGESYDKRGISLLKKDIENDRYIELWNIVFSQFNAENGVDRKNYKELPSKNIDTGAGLERFACIIQNTKTNYETDLFMPIINEVEKISKIKYTGQKEFRIISDHIRALTVTISDGAIFSNEGRGYVLRRLLRRSLKHARKLNLTKPFLYKLTDIVNKMLGDIYPNIREKLPVIKKIIKAEELNFLKTLESGEKEFNKIVSKQNKISGKDAFLLYDTYGFPIELTVEYAQEKKAKVDIKGFQKELQKQILRSRKNRKEEESMQIQDKEYLNFKEKSKFVGYNKLESKSKVIKVFKNGIVLDKTPFYAESGGQESDIGFINDIKINKVIKLPHGQHLHIIKNASLKKGDEVLAKIDKDNRINTSNNHSATHLLHLVLKEKLGKNVNQHGSRVNAKSLRFDFNFYEQINSTKIIEIEKQVNKYISNNYKVLCEEMDLKTAKNLGAIALFIDKYEDKVRVITMGKSKELCGGTHVNKTKDINKFAIIDYQTIGSGIFRIEAITGPNINKLYEERLNNIFNQIKDLDKRLNKILVKEIEFKGKLSKPKIVASYENILIWEKYINDYKTAIKEYDKLIKKKKDFKKESNFLKEFDYSTLKSPNDIFITKDYSLNIIKSAVDTIFKKNNMSNLIVCEVNKNKFSYFIKSNDCRAKELMDIVNNITNARGGGRDNFASGGNGDSSKLDDLVDKLNKLFKN